MKFLKVVIILTLLIKSISAYAEDTSYLCVAEKSTGFLAKNGAWDNATFRITLEKYLIRKVDPVQDKPDFKDDNFTYGVFSLGSSVAQYMCQHKENNTIISCVGSSGQFLYDVSTGKFLKTFVKGYWDGNMSTPNITIGNCSLI